MRHENATYCRRDGAVSLGGFSGGRERAQMAFSAGLVTNSSDKPFPQNRPFSDINAGIAAFPQPLKYVLAVLSHGGGPEVPNPVVRAIAISMVYLVGVDAVMHLVDDTGGVEPTIVQPDRKIALRNAVRVGSSAGIFRVPYLRSPDINEMFRWPHPPSQRAAVSVVIEAFVQICLLWQWYSRLWHSVTFPQPNKAASYSAPCLQQGE